MHFLILSGNEKTQNLLRYALCGEDCTYKAVGNLTDLFVEIRLRMPAAIVLDKDFFRFHRTLRKHISKRIYAPLFFSINSILQSFYTTKAIYKICAAPSFRAFFAIEP